jgi:hypothetical protein
MTVSFQGQITAIGPNIAAGYAPGDIAQLYVECAIQGSKDWYDITGTWPVLYSIDSLGISNQLLGSISFSWIWTTSQNWRFAKTITIGPMTDQPITGTFVLLLGLGTVYLELPVAAPTMLDSKEFTIPLKEEVVVPPIPWKQIGIGLGIVTVVSVIIAVARR